MASPRIASRAAPGAITLVLCAAACGGDTTPPEPALTEQEAIQLFEALKEFESDVSFAGIPGLQERFVIDCPYGGLAEFVGWLDEETVADTTRLYLNRQISPANCWLSIDDVLYSVHGNPSVIEQTLTETIGDSGHFVVEGVIFGALGWVSEGRAAECRLDLTLSMESDLADPENPMLAGDISGELCGHLVIIEVSEPL